MSFWIRITPADLEETTPQEEDAAELCGEEWRARRGKLLQRFLKQRVQRALDSFVQPTAATHSILRVSKAGYGLRLNDLEGRLEMFQSGRIASQAMDRKRRVTEVTF